MKTIIILAGVPYWSMRQRPQHMARYFASKDYQVVYISLTEVKGYFVKTDFDQPVSLLNDFFYVNEEGVYLFREKLRNNQNEGVSFGDFLQKLQYYLGSKNVVFIVGFPDWIRYLDKISSKSILIYDCMDDWESFVTDLKLGYNHTTIYNERKLAGISDLIIVSAKSLYIKMAKYNDNVYYLPNGVWNNDYQRIKKKNELPDDLKNIKKPIVFFMGAIAGWVDINLIKFLANTRKEYSFVFVGDEIGEKLPNESNIYFLGKKKYEDLPLYLNEAKVAIVPFKVNSLTMAVTPLKFYEYLGSATPVVTTILPDLIGLPGSKMAQSYEEFLKYIDDYIMMDAEQYSLEMKRAVETSKRFDWAKLLEPLCLYIDEEKLEIIPKNQFLQNMINDYEVFQNNICIQNELVNLYNMTGNYDLSYSLLKENECFSYNQAALTFYKLGDIEHSLFYLRKYFGEEKIGLFEVYLDSIINDVNRFVFLELFNLKLCGFTYEALKKFDEFHSGWESNPKFLGILSGLYLDVGEYNIAFRLAIDALSVNEENIRYEQILDFYTMSFLILQLAQEGEYSLAESIALSLMNINSSWEKEISKLLGDIYFSKEWEKVLKNE